MKIIKLNDDFTINYGVPIDEFSYDGIKQSVYEVLKFNKKSDIYNEDVGVGYFDFLKAENVNEKTILKLQESIIKELLTIPYVVDVKNIAIKKEEKYIIFDIDLIYLGEDVGDIRYENKNDVLKNIQIKFNI